MLPHDCQIAAPEHLVQIANRRVIVQTVILCVMVRLEDVVVVVVKMDGQAPIAKVMM